MHTIDQPFAHVCIKFQLCRTHRKVWQKINALELVRKKWRNKGIYKHQPGSSTHDTSTYCQCVDQVSTLCATQSLRKERWKFLISENWRERKVKGRISRRNLVLFHMKPQWFTILVPNYKILCAIVLEKYLSQIPLCIKLEWEMEKRRKKATQTSVLFSVPQYTWPLPMCIKNMKTLGLIKAKKFVTNFAWRESKMDK